MEKAHHVVCLRQRNRMWFGSLLKQKLLLKPNKILKSRSTAGVKTLATWGMRGHFWKSSEVFPIIRIKPTWENVTFGSQWLWYHCKRRFVFFTWPYREILVPRLRAVGKKSAWYRHRDKPAPRAIHLFFRIHGMQKREKKKENEVVRIWHCDILALRYFCNGNVRVIN